MEPEGDPHHHHDDHRRTHGDHHHTHDGQHEDGSPSWVGTDVRVYHSHDGLAPHSHEPIYSPGLYDNRALPLGNRDFKERAFTFLLGPERNTRRRVMKTTTWYHDPGRFIVPDLEARARGIASDQTVNLHFTNNELTAAKIIKTMLREIHDSQDSQEIAAFCGSIIAGCFFDFKEALASAMAIAVGGVVIIDDSNRDGFLFMLDDSDSALQTLMYVAQTILIMFKSINQSSYEQFMTKQMKALKAVVGIPETENVNLIMAIDKAVMVRARLGSHLSLKKKIVELLIVRRDLMTPIGAMSNYLCNILEWHEMTNVLFIVQTLVATDSPVLYDLHISSDILSFIEAAKAIQSSSYYGFFRIRETNQYRRGLVERSRFPILSAVAQKIKSQTANSAINYKGIPGQTPAVVNLLVMKHNQHMSGRQPEFHRDQVQFLTRVTEEEEEA